MIALSGVAGLKFHFGGFVGFYHITTVRWWSTSAFATAPTLFGESF